MRSTHSIILGLVLAGCGPKSPPSTPAPGASEVVGDGVSDTKQSPSAGGAVSAPPALPSQESLAERVEAANEWLTTGKPEDASTALALYREMVDEAPDSAQLRFNIGLAYEGIGDAAGARKAYLRATDVDPGLAEAWLNLGAMAEREGDHARALQSYRAGLRHAEADPQLFAATIGVLRKLGRHDEAVREARSAIKTNGNNVDAYNNLGLVYLEQGKLELAQFIYQRALSAIPDADSNALVHANLGRVYLAQGKIALAEKKFQDALLKDNDLVVAMMFLGQLYTQNRNWEGTIAVLERARELERDNAAIRVNLGIGYRGLGRMEESEASYKKALELDESLIETHLNLALLYGDSLQQFEKAYEALDTYLDVGGARTELVDTWRADFEKTQAKLERDAARKKRREEQRRKREEEKRLLAEEEQRKAEEAAAAPPPAPEAETEAAPAAGAEPTLPPAVEPVPAGPAGEDVPSDAWGTSTPDPAREQGSVSSAVGQSCSGVGSCGDASLECAQDDVCREVGTPGTFGVGVGCVESGDCASGLSCVDNSCAEGEGAPGGSTDGGAVPGTGSPWGGQ